MIYAYKDNKEHSGLVIFNLNSNPKIHSFHHPFSRDLNIPENKSIFSSVSFPVFISEIDGIFYLRPFLIRKFAIFSAGVVSFSN